MTKQNANGNEQLMYWRKLKERLSLVEDDDRVSGTRVDQLLQQLPARVDGEDMHSWIRRVMPSTPHARSDDGSISSATRRRFRPLTEIVRLAASTSMDHLPLPDSGRGLETPDGRFRLSVEANGPRIAIGVQALGFFSDEFANCSIGIAANWEDEPLVVVPLDADGDGEVEALDSAKLRQALLRPVMGVLDDD